jgi:hypothetical protein
MTKSKRDIRVNLRFGILSDPWIVEKLSSLPPRERARWVRAWIIDGSRQLRALGAETPVVPKASAQPLTSPEEDGSTKESMFTLLGKTIL